MNTGSYIIQCGHCKTRNRVPKTRVKDQPVWRQVEGLHAFNAKPRDYEYESRESNDDLFDYDTNTFMFFVNFAL